MSGIHLREKHHTYLIAPNFTFKEKPVRYKDADRLFYGYFKTIVKPAKDFGSA
ncbi:MAG: hypothetical protein J7J86_04955 [Bacteroidales bacterium]|nr:hypothetical protein [Bacteroidales bacterium]